MAGDTADRQRSAPVPKYREARTERIGKKRLSSQGAEKSGEWRGYVKPVYCKIADSGKGRASPPRGRHALLLDRGEVHGGPPGREHFKGG